MKYQKYLRVLIPVIGLLAIAAAGTGLLYQTPGESYEHTNHRGETVLINGQGLYFHDTVSMAAQQQGNDLIVLTVGLPLLVISTWFAFRGSLRAHLMLTGTLGFFLYTYLSMSMLSSFNVLFLAYVALLAASLYAFILSMMAFDIADLAQHFTTRFPRVWIAVFMFVVGAFLLLAWLGRVITPLVQNVAPVLENTTTLVIQAMDLALIVPLAVLAGVLLLRRSPWGYLLSAVMLLKGVTLGLGVSAMAVNMTIQGQPDSLSIMIPFLAITVASLVLAVLMLRSVDRASGEVPTR